MKENMKDIAKYKAQEVMKERTQEKNSFQKNLVSSVIISQYLADDLLGQETYRNVKVHSVFPNGFNLIMDEQLIFIGKHGSDLSAFGLTLDARVFDQLRAVLVVGQRVRIDPIAWTFYTRPILLQLVLGNVKKIAVEIVPVSREQFKVSPLADIIESADVFKQSGFARSPELLELLEIWQAKARDTGSLLHPDIVRQLIGAGIGLTPSGDDFLQGMLLVEKAISAEPSLKICVQAALKDRSTTAVSLAYYQALFAGKVNISWVNLLTAVKNTQDLAANLTAAVHQIQQYGATSGNDILLGIQMALKFI